MRLCRRSRRLAVTWIAVHALTAALTGGILAAAPGCGATSSVRNSPPDVQCQSNLERIGRAIAAYRSQHRDFPQVVSGPGKLQHSWRVAIAPHLFAPPNYPIKLKYRFDEPWDSQHNRECVLDESGLSIRYTCPFESTFLDYPFVTYVMLVRPTPEGPKDGSVVRSSLPPDAVLIVESANCGITCGQPKDLDWNTLWEGASPFGKGKLSSLHPHVVKAIRVDGKVIDIPKTIGKAELRKLLNGQM